MAKPRTCQNMTRRLEKNCRNFGKEQSNGTRSGENGGTARRKVLRLQKLLHIAQMYLIEHDH